MVDKRRARLEAERHARDVDLDEDVVGQVGVDVELQQPAERSGACDARDAGERLGGRVAREPLAQLVRVDVGLLGGREVADEAQVAGRLVGREVLAVLAHPARRAAGKRSQHAATPPRSGPAGAAQSATCAQSSAGSRRTPRRRRRRKRDRHVPPRHLRQEGRHRRRVGERLVEVAHDACEQVATMSGSTISSWWSVRSARRPRARTAARCIRASPKPIENVCTGRPVARAIRRHDGRRVDAARQEGARAARRTSAAADRLLDGRAHAPRPPPRSSIAAQRRRANVGGRSSAARRAARRIGAQVCPAGSLWMPAKIVTRRRHVAAAPGSHRAPPGRRRRRRARVGQQRLDLASANTKPSGAIAVVERLLAEAVARQQQRRAAARPRARSANMPAQALEHAAPPLLVEVDDDLGVAGAAEAVARAPRARRAARR